jgi:hypothetical protein
MSWTKLFCFISVFLFCSNASLVASSRGDLNGDGHPDIIWQNDTTRQVAAWYMGGAQGNQFQFFGWISSVPILGWTVVAVTDLNGDGHPDVIWENDGTRQVAVWYMGGAQGNEFQFLDWISSGPLPGWTVAAMADLDGNGHPDVIWQNDSTRQVAIWYMGGALGNQFQSLGWISSAPVVDWRVVSVVDLNGDGHVDVVWQNDSTRQAVVWYMGGAQGDQVQFSDWISNGSLPGWTIAGMTDLDGDGHPDLLWQNDSTRQVAVWYMDGITGNQFRYFDWINSGPLPGWRALVAN